MPSLTAQRLISEFGSDTDYKFAGSVQVKTATTLSASFGVVNRYEPWNNASAKSLLAYHPVAVWKDLAVRLAPRPGIYGRMCTFYGGWGAAGLETPTSVDDMVNLHGAIDVTYGGTGDPGTVRVNIPCDFDDTMKDLLKGPDNNSSRPVFFYCFTEVDVVASPADADRFMLTFKVSRSQNATGNVESKPYGEEPAPKTTTTNVLPPVEESPTDVSNFEAAFEDAEDEVYTFINGKQHTFDECSRDSDGDWKLTPTYRCQQQHITTGALALIKEQSLTLLALKAMMYAREGEALVIPASLALMQEFIVSGHSYSLLRNGMLLDNTTNASIGTSLNVILEVLNFTFVAK